MKHLNRARRLGGNSAHVLCYVQAGDNSKVGNLTKDVNDSLGADLNTESIWIRRAKRPNVSWQVAMRHRLQAMGWPSPSL
jgi:hypothetical protein